MSVIPKSHPRYVSLRLRERIADGMKQGLVHETGLIAHGRGEAFDYLLGEKTISIADSAAKVAAAMLLDANSPIISVNGNVAALASDACVQLAQCLNAKLEVNLFHRTQQRVNLVVEQLKRSGADRVYGDHATACIPGLEHDRALCDKNGIFAADVVLVLLEDGDRCRALADMGKQVIAVDLNPLSRTAQSADVTIVDNVVRALPNIKRWTTRCKTWGAIKRKQLIKNWDNTAELGKLMQVLSKRLNSLF